MLHYDIYMQHQTYTHYTVSYVNNTNPDTFIYNLFILTIVKNIHI